MPDCEAGEAGVDRVERVRLTQAAERLLGTLIEQHGPVMFHQSGGCCDGSAPMCYPRSGFSLEAPEGVRFLLRSRLMTDEEAARIAAEPPPPHGGG